MRRRYTASVAATLLFVLAAQPVIAAQTNPPAQAPATPLTGPPYDDRKFSEFEVTAQPMTPPRAPADEYFGKLKLSYLGIRNIVHDINVEGDSPLALPRQMGRIDAAHSAMLDWAEKYPRDNWLPRYMLSFAKMLQSKGQPFMDGTAVDLLFYMTNRYAGNRFGAQALGLVRDYTQTPDFTVEDQGEDPQPFVVIASP